MNISNIEIVRRMWLGIGLTVSRRTKPLYEPLKNVPSWLGNKTFVHAPRRNDTVMGSLQNVQIYFYLTI